MALSKRRPMEEETHLLFVYGSLMRGMERASFIGNPQKRSLPAPALRAERSTKWVLFQHD
jgi:hypothetical protein